MKGIIISKELLMELHQKGIDPSQVSDIVSYAEEGLDKIFDEKTCTYFAHKRIGKVTIWVGYRMDKDKIKIESVYVHRLDIREKDQ